MHLWKGDKKFRLGPPPPLICTKSKRTAAFFVRPSLSLEQAFSSLVEGAPPPSAPAARLVQSLGLAAPSYNRAFFSRPKYCARCPGPVPGPLVASRIYWSLASIIANQISMEGGGPGPGAAQPQYEEQLLHTQVKSSCLAFLPLKFSPFTSCSVVLIHNKDIH